MATSCRSQLSCQGGAVTDPAAFWVAGLAVGSLVGAGLGFVVGYAIGNLKRRRPASRFDEGRVQRGNGNGGITTPKPPIVPKGQLVRTHRWFINNPVQIAECNGPCTINPAHCDCGALWFVDVPTTNPPSSAP